MKKSGAGASSFKYQDGKVSAENNNYGEYEFEANMTDNEVNARTKVEGRTEVKVKIGEDFKADAKAQAMALAEGSAKI